MLSNFFGSGRLVLNFRSSNVVDAHGGSKDGTIVVLFALDTIYLMSNALLCYITVLLIAVGTVSFKARLVAQ